MRSPLRPTTATDWLDDHLRSEILANRMAPGEKIVLSTLAGELGVSATPLREALTRLSVDGFVDWPAHGSPRVASVSRQEAFEIYDLRCQLEPGALRTAIEAATDDDRDAWTDSFDRLRSGSSPAQNLALHTAFHRSLISSCPSRWLLRTLIPLQDHALRIVAAGDVHAGDYDIKADHRPVLRMALDSDADGAAAWLYEHLDRSRRGVQAQPGDTQ